MGDLLRIDLTTRTSREETIPPELIREFIGAKGLGTHYLCAEVGPEVEPLDPGAKLIFAIGPMAGTTMLGSNRYGLFFVSPLTGAYCECYSGGNLTPQFARTGYKVVIVEGKADGHVYLEISEQGVAFHSVLPKTLSRRCGSCHGPHANQNCRRSPFPPFPEDTPGNRSNSR